EKYPSPRKMFLCPEMPAKGATMLAKAAVGFGNAFGWPLTMWWPPEETGPETKAKLCVAQSVPHPAPSTPEKGSPLVQCTKPATSHPEINVLTIRFGEDAKVLPLPKGIM